MRVAAKRGWKAAPQVTHMWHKCGQWAGASENHYLYHLLCPTNHIHSAFSYLFKNYNPKFAASTHPNTTSIMSNTVHVKGISSQTSEKEVQEFFSFW